MKDTIPVRGGEELHEERLRDYLQQHIATMPAGDLHIEQFPNGKSNLTYFLRVGEWEAVLRRPPFGPVPPKAHDMQREFTILQTIHPIFPIAPKPYLYSADESLVGSPFFVMERRRGIVLDTEFPDEMIATPTLCRQLSETMVDVLVRLHGLDYEHTKLATMSKPDGFMERQVHGWIGRYERAKTSDVTGTERLFQWMINHVPATSEATIIHYDYKLNNAMFSPDMKQMVGLFDWEMTTVGDPLADLGAAMGYWVLRDDPELLKSGLGKPPVTVHEGFMTRREFIEAYAVQSGRDVKHMQFYMTFAYFKLAVIVQQIYFRFKNGQTADHRFAHLDQMVISLMQYALQITEDSTVGGI
ncbi:MAG: phosphotransferase family protein [Acidibacillus sp.]|nr:phosphotransferase family protein [Acidibacillus sp.]